MSPSLIEWMGKNSILEQKAHKQNNYNKNSGRQNTTDIQKEKRAVATCVEIL